MIFASSVYDRARTHTIGTHVHTRTHALTHTRTHSHEQEPALTFDWYFFFKFFFFLLSDNPFNENRFALHIIHLYNTYNTTRIYSTCRYDTCVSTYVVVGIVFKNTQQTQRYSRIPIIPILTPIPEYTYLEVYTLVNLV